jgi:DNA-binding transcriptional regulator GbsR (MarR family)
MSLEEIQQMKNEMERFMEESPELDEREEELKRVIAEKENRIKNQSAAFEQVSKWTEIVIDKRYRYELIDGIKRKRKELSEIESCNHKV